VLDPTATRSREALVAEINAGLFLAFALALLYLGGSVTFTGKYQTISSLSDYQRVAIVAGLSGIAGGWLIERVAETLTRWFSARLSNSE
jgi:hypothetical protein